MERCVKNPATNHIRLPEQHKTKALYDQQLPLVDCDERQIQQAVLNLLMNCAQALHEKSAHLNKTGKQHRGKITLRLKRQARNVRIEIEDNGPGLDTKNRERIFEPFFSTQTASEEAGLGLFISYLIITQNHNGTLEAESLPDEGTMMVICLPITPTQ